MTTSANPAPSPTDPEASPPESYETWRAIGRLEGTANALLEGQREVREGLKDLRGDLDTGLRDLRGDLDTGLRDLRGDLDTGLREVNRRIDRLFYAILGVGGALMVAMFASRFIGS